MPKLNTPYGGEYPRPAVATSDRDSPLFSIVIPALNEETVIGKCLDSIAHLEFPRRNFEVIVVDNGSSDRTREVAESFRNVLQIKILVRPKINISALRNAGAAVALGIFLIFLDADMMVAKNWLQNAESLCVSSRAEIMGGFFEVPKDASWVARVWFRRKTKAVDLCPSYVPSGNLMVRRSQFEALGGFDESLRTNEDCEFCGRGRARGLQLAVYDLISVVHLGSPQTLGTFFRRELWHGTSVFLVFLRNLSSFRNGKSVFFALYTLLCLLALVITGMVAVYRGRIVLVSVAAALLLLGPLALAVRESHSQKKWKDLPPLFVLFLLYGVARGLSILGVSMRQASERSRLGTMQDVSNETTANRMAP